jgi:creatinine amidohydrolase
MAAIRRWQDLAWPAFETLDAERTVAVLPVGAIEQHGPHLPVAVDALIAGEVAARAFAFLADDVPALLLPTSSIGKSNEHIDYPGTLTLSAETLTRVWFETGQSVARAGVRKIVFLNAHGGQPQVMEIVARELRVREKMMAVTTGWWHVAGPPPEAVSDAERRHGIHGGQVETSMMLALAPELVSMY